MTEFPRVAEALLNIQRVLFEIKLDKFKAHDALMRRQELADMTGASIEEFI